MKALIFDLDGTLVDSVYQHVIAWQRALEEIGVPCDAERLHKCIGMSGKLLMREAARVACVTLTPQAMKSAEARHAALFLELVPRPRPLTGALELLAGLRGNDVSFGIATSGERKTAEPALQALGVAHGVVVVDGSSGKPAKPEPDLFVECARQLSTPCEECFVVGDAVWDLLAARRGGLQSIGMLCGGYAEEDLYRAGAYRVYAGPPALQSALMQLGFDV